MLRLGQSSDQAIGDQPSSSSSSIQLRCQSLITLLNSLLGQTVEVGLRLCWGGCQSPGLPGSTRQYQKAPRIGSCPHLKPTAYPLPLSREKQHFPFSACFRWCLLRINPFRGCA